MRHCPYLYELQNLFDHEDYADLQAELTAMLESRPDDRLPLQVQVGMA